MGSLINTAELTEVWRSVLLWLMEQVLVLSTLIQLLALVAALGLAMFVAPHMQRWIGAFGKKKVADYSLARAGDAVSRLSLPIIWLVFAWIMGLVSSGIGWPHHLVTIASSLLTAWISINLASNLIRNKSLSQSVAITAWTIAALNILNLLDPTVTMLDSAAFKLGDIRISFLTVIEGVLALVVLLWAAIAVGNLLERRISRSQNLTPSVQVLFAKLLKVVLFAIAVIVALEAVGIDLSAFTVFTGALGVGIGFGLQKTVSNLISGVMILMDKSIKPGDVIEVGGTYGWVNSLGSRYASVITRDGVEHLIPNEELITTPVSNWSFSNNQIRQRVPVGISYDSDPRKAIELCLEAANEVDRVLKEPKSNCLVTGFGDSSVDLELRFWINDPKNGIGNVKSELLLRIWDKLHEHGIQIPFPQRDIHIQSRDGLHNAESSEATIKST